MPPGRCRKIVVAGTHSGVGKTSVSLALTASLSRRGLRIQPFKVGPDYLDPTHLSRAAGAVCYNLDGWMCGRAYVCDLFERWRRGADIAVVEGVMGLFDGAGVSPLNGSTAQIATWLDAPVLLVVDAGGMAGSIAALVHGFASFAPSVRIAGIIANRVGSESHGQLLAKALDAAELPPLIGAIPKSGLPSLADRHLGLLTADSHTLSAATLTALADGFDQWVDLSRIIDLESRAPEGALGDESNVATIPPAVGGSPIRVGVADDPAFHFYYPDNLEALTRAGCRLIRFSPLSDSGLPPDLDGLYLGGGYPEVHAETLSNNRGMRASIQMFAARGRPIYAECGGLMYLSREIVDHQERRFPMLGILPCSTRMLKKQRRLGYAEVTLAQDSLFGTAGTLLRGHEFHYSDLIGDPASDSAWQRIYSIHHPNRRSRSEGFQNGRILASYVHLHFASVDGAAAHFATQCRASREVHHVH